MALSSDTKWIIGTLLVLITLVLAVAGSAWELGRTLATKSDLEDLATTADVREESARLEAAVTDVSEVSTRLETTVGDLRTTVGRLDATVDSLDATVSDLGAAVADVRATVDGFQKTTDAVNTLVTVTLPALFNCMIELDSARGANRVGGRQGGFPDTSLDANSPMLPYTCMRLRDDFDAVDSLVPQPPD